jgi:hypothetical protein
MGADAYVKWLATEGRGGLEKVAKCGRRPPHFGRRRRPPHAATPSRLQHLGEKNLAGRPSAKFWQRILPLGAYVETRPKADAR